MKAKPRTPKPGWVVVGPDGKPRWSMSANAEKQGAINQFVDAAGLAAWAAYYRLGYRVRRCQVKP